MTKIERLVRALEIVVAGGESRFWYLSDMREVADLAVEALPELKELLGPEEDVEYVCVGDELDGFVTAKPAKRSE
jgi:hypothetical protein